jgi:hypothetical protein
MQKIIHYINPLAVVQRVQKRKGGAEQTQATGFKMLSVDVGEIRTDSRGTTDRGEDLTTETRRKSENSRKKAQKAQNGDSPRIAANALRENEMQNQKKTPEMKDWEMA